MVSDRCPVCPVLSVCLSVTLVYCGQTVGSIQMKLSAEVGLGPGDIVLDRDPAPLPQKRGRHSLLQLSADVYCGQTAGCIRIPLGTEVGLGPGDIVLHGNPAPPQSGTAAPPLFGPCPLSPNGRPSATAEHLLIWFILKPPDVGELIKSTWACITPCTSQNSNATLSKQGQIQDWSVTV